jgi:hypothetical protein
MNEPDNRVALEQVRDRTVALLGQRFAEDLIDEDELDERMEQAQTANTIAALRKLTADLEDPNAPEPSFATHESGGLAPFSGPAPDGMDALGTQRPVVALARPEDVRDHQRSVTLFGESKQTGAWTPPRILTSFTAFGETKLDFREARLAPGVTEVELQTLFGEVEIILPPDLPVEVGCSAILASLSTDDQLATEAPHDPDAPRLRITGFAMFAEVGIYRRLPGESKREAKRRKKALRKAERKALRAAKRRRD